MTCSGWPLLPRNAAICSLTLRRCVIIKVMGTELSMRRRLQALAASRATRGPQVKRVSQVGGHFHHHMKLHLESCLGSVLSPQLMGHPLSMRQRLQVLAASRATREPTGQTGVTGGWTLSPLHDIRVCLSCLNSMCLNSSDGASVSTYDMTCRRQRLHGRHGSHRSNGCHRWVATLATKCSNL